jgi:hypothetical protein
MVIPKVIVKPLSKNGHWHFEEPMDKDAYSGFIYVIRDPFMKRFYLGKKLFKGSGKLNKGQESNWKTYCSSSNSISEMLAERPKTDFEFICIEQYKAKGALSYAETWSLCHVEAPTKKEWYNKRIEKISWNVSENITERHKERLNKALSWGDFKGEI